MKHHKFIYSLIISFLASIALSIPAAAQSVYVISGQVRDHQGNVVPAAKVIILSGNLTTVNTATQPGSPLATIYSDPAGTMAINQLTNPVTTNGTGQFVAYAATGNYVIQAYRNGFQLVTPISITANGTGCVVSGSTGQVIINNGSGGCSSVGNVIYMDGAVYPCTSTGINSALAASTSSQVVVDARGCSGTITWSSTVTVGSSSKVATLLLDRATKENITITNDTPALNIYGGSSVIVAGETEAPGSTTPVGGFYLPSSASVHVPYVIGIINQATTAGFSIEGVTVTSNPDTTGAAPVIDDALVYLVNPLQVGTARGLTVGAYANIPLLEITQTVGGSVGPINFYNPELDCSGIAGCKPLLIQGISGGGSMGGLNFIGGTYVHAGSGLPIVDIEGVGAANNAGGANFSGPFLESTYANTIGFKINNSHGVRINEPFFSAIIPGLEAVEIDNGNTDGISILGADNFNNWTNNVVNNAIATPVTYPSSNGNRFDYHYGLGNKTDTYIWDDSLGTRLVVDQNGVTTPQLNTQNITLGPPGSAVQYFLNLFSSANLIYGNGMTQFVLKNENSGTNAGVGMVWQGDGSTSRFGWQVKTGSTATDVGCGGPVAGGQGNVGDLNAVNLLFCPSLITARLPVLFQDNNTFDAYNDFQEIAAPSNPASGFERWYANLSTHQFSCLTSSGSSCAPTGGSGAFSGGLGSSYQDVTEISAPSNPASGNDRLYLDSSSHLLACVTSGGADCMPSAGGSLAVGTTTVSGGTNGYLLYENAGVLGAENPSSLGITIAGTLVGLGGSTTSFPNPGAIGSGTPAAANFTTLGASGHVIFNGLQTTGTIAFAICLDSGGNLIANASGNCYSGGGGGTVTSVALSMPSIFGVSGSPITGAGTLTATLNNQSANQVFAGPCTGSAATPAFRSLCNQDIPLPTTSLQGGVIALSAAVSNQFETYIDTSGVQHTAQVNFSNLAGSASCSQLPALTGDVTTSAGACASSYNNTVPATKGGTGVASPTAHDVPVAEGSSPFNFLSPGASGQCFMSNGTSADPTFQNCPSGGPGTGTLNALAYWATTSTLGSVPGAITGQVPVATHSAAPAFSSGGVGGRIFTGSGGTDSIACDSSTATVDRNTTIIYNTSTATTVTVPSAAATGCGSNTQGDNNFTFAVLNIGSATITLNPTTSTLSVANGQSTGSGTGKTTLALTTGQYASFNSTDNVNYAVRVSPTPGSGSGSCPGSGGSQYDLVTVASTTTNCTPAKVQVDSTLNNIVFPQPSGTTYGTVTALYTACYTGSQQIGNCGTSATNVLGVFVNSSGAYQATGWLSGIILDGTQSPVYGDILCASTTTGGEVHDNGSTLCGAISFIGIVSTSATSVTTVSAWLAVKTPNTIGGSAGGDLAGTYPNPTVNQIEGAAIPASTPLIGTNSSKQLVAGTTISSLVFQEGAPGGSALTTGPISYITIPKACTLTHWDIDVDAGTATVQTWKVATGTAIPTVSNTISTSGVAISTGTAIRSATLTDFTTTTFAAGDIVAANLGTTSGVGFINFQLEFTCAQ